MTPEDRFWSKVDKAGPVPAHRPGMGACWVWKGARSPTGYGQFRSRAFVGGVAHRTSYRLLVGDIPQGKELDHLCRNRGCVRPDHLEPVTHAENVARGGWGEAWRSRAIKTHCKRGHPLTPENTYQNKGNSRTMGRGCITCRREGQRVAGRERPDLWKPSLV